MATITSASLSDPRRTAATDLQSPFAELRAFWRQFVARAFNPYRPELHYMRGPGPAWRAKHLSPLAELEPDRRQSHLERRDRSHF